MLLTLTVTPFSFQAADGVELFFQQHPGTVGRLEDPLVVAHPGINLFGYGRVHGVDGHGDVADLQFGQLVDVGTNAQAVGGHAKQHLGVGGPDPPEGPHGLARVGEGVPRSGDAHHRDSVGFFREDGVEVDHGLFRREHAGGHAGPAFVDAVEFPVAELALDIAAGGHRQVDPPEGVSRFVVETGVSV